MYLSAFLFLLHFLSTQMVQAEIAQFETNRKKMVTSGFASFSR